MTSTHIWAERTVQDDRRIEGTSKSPLSHESFALWVTKAASNMACSLLNDPDELRTRVTKTLRIDEQFTNKSDAEL